MTSRRRGRQLRQDILHYLLNRERSSDSSIPGLDEIAGALGVPKEDINDQLDILESKGAIKSNRTFKDAAPMLTGVGKAILEEMGEDGKNSPSKEIPKPELELFHDGFIRYRELVLKKRREGLTDVEESEFQTLSNQLQRKYGRLQKVIKEYGGSSELLLQGGEYKCEALSSAFDYTMFDPGALEAVLDKAIATINMAIGNLEEPLDSQQPQKGDIFPSGKPYDAYEAIRNIVTTATKNILIVDPWVDGTLFSLLSTVQPNVKIQILTENMKGDFELAGQKFKEQYEKAQRGTLDVRKSDKFHDRFIIADGRIFHIGASLKDAGNKTFALSEFDGSEVKSKISKIISGHWNRAKTVL